MTIAGTPGKKGFLPPWNKDGWSTQEEADKEHKKIIARVAPDYDRLAAIYANLLSQQADILRRKQLEVKKRRGNEVPKHLQITQADLDWLLKANREVLQSRAMLQKEKAEAKKVKKDAFIDPRAGEGQEEPEELPGWESDGRQGS